MHPEELPFFGEAIGAKVVTLERGQSPNLAMRRESRHRKDSVVFFIN
jgi:hypothetical protein